MKPNSEYLINKDDLLVLKKQLALVLGLNEALLVQQVNYWLSNEKSGVKHEGRRWIWNSYADWQEQFPFWSERTIKRIVASAKKTGVLLVKQVASKSNNQTNYYSIDYDVLDQLISKKTPKKAPKKPIKSRVITSDNLSGCQCGTSDNLAQGGVTTCHALEGDNLARCYKEQRLPETTTETTTKCEPESDAVDEKVCHRLADFSFPSNLDEKVCKQAIGILKNLPTDQGQQCLDVLSRNLSTGKPIANQAAYLTILAEQAAIGGLGLSQLESSSSGSAGGAVVQPVRGQAPESASRKHELYSQLKFYEQQAVAGGYETIRGWAKATQQAAPLAALDEYKQLAGVCNGQGRR